MTKRNINPIVRLSSLLLALVLLCALAVMAYATETEPVCYGYGDVNSDNGVDGRDAIYALYHVMFAESYPVNQNCDFNNDGSVDSKDAIQLLYGSMDMIPGCTLGGTVHQYFAPEWNWINGESVSVKFRCGCGNTQELTQSNGINILKETVSERSCTEAEILKYTAKVTFDGVEYTSEYTETTLATGHTMSGTSTCLEGSSCTVCDFTLPALGHEWVENKDMSKPATCQSPAVQVYECSREDCFESKTVELVGLAEHNFQYVQDTKLDAGCGKAKEYQCSVCDKTMLSEPFYTHTYTAKLTKEATCSTEGEKVLTCVCGDTQNESIPKNDSHTWDAGVTDNSGITTFTCTGCGETKTTMKVDSNEAIEKDALGSAELQLEDAGIKLDEDTLNGLGQTIALNVEILSTDDISLDSSHAQQIGSNPIYDFSLYSDDSQVSEFAGSITVMLPYTLQEGDDVDCIDVWFISDNGDVEVVQGTYANGFVTFTTNHFSYYTVTRLTPEQRCEKYGHAMGTDHQDPTCTSNGHHVVVCRRCGLEEENSVLERLPHNYQETREAPTCTKDGSFESICSVCLQKVSGILPSLGHSWELNQELSSAPGCTTVGKDVYVCANGCNETYTEEKVALGHKYEMIGQINPDCTTSGYEGYKCKTCAHEYKSNEASPVGHDFTVDTATWQWAEGYTSATVTLVCSRNPEHTQTLTAVISKTVDAPNCNAGGEVIYTATAAFNLQEYTDTKTVQMDKVGHLADDTWQSNIGAHYHTCTSCGEMVDVSAHVWGNTTVITPATCHQTGTGKAECTICGYEKDVVIEATGKHKFIGGVCSVCSFHKDDCKHNAIYPQEIDLNSFNLCSGYDVNWLVCDCGENKQLSYGLGCSFSEEAETEETLPNGKTGTMHTSTCGTCGLVLKFASYDVVDEATCSGSYVYWTRMIKDGQTIIDYKNEGIDTFTHNAIILVETIDLTDNGLCGLVLNKYRCHCGKNVHIYQDEGKCDWDYLGYEDNTSTFVCAVCGVTRTQKQTTNIDKANCQGSETNVFTYLKDNTELYSYTNEYSWDAHDYKVTDFKLEGDSCEDGVTIHQECSVCKKQNSYYATWHEMFNDTVKDISDLGLCVKSYTYSACVCGKETYISFDDGENPCEWEDVSYDSATETEIRRCVKCGLTETEMIVDGEKDANCQRQRTTTITYKKPDGSIIVESIRKRVIEDHDMLVTQELKGKTCENGVKITEVCKSCGYTDQWTTDGHSTSKVESYDLSQYGMCGGELALHRCACGYYSRYRWNNDRCEWHWVSGDSNTDTYRCAECGVTRKTTYSEEKNVDGCRYERDATISLSKNNKTLLKVGFTETLWRHSYLHTFQLKGTSCMDGYRVTETCTACGASDSWNVTNEEYHGTWVVDRKMLVEGKFCSDLELVTYKCACGTYQNQEIHWSGKSCEYYSSEYIESEKAWLYTCIDCGGQRLEKGQELKSDLVCAEKYQRTYVFYQNDTELCRVERLDIDETHDWLYTYEPLGKECSDGYYYTRTCADCGRTRGKSGINYECWNRLVDREILLDHKDICGTVSLCTYDCACGKEYRQSISGHCNWSYIGYESGKGDICVCDDCGLRRVGDDTVIERDGCKVTVNAQYTYSLDGTTLLELDETIFWKEHDTVATFKMDGTSCEDGYQVYYTCVHCGRQTSSGYYYDHEIFDTKYYDLTEYGLCGGEIWLQNCACGQESDYYHSYGGNCNWYTTGKTVDGLTEQYCAKCNTYRYASEIGKRDPETCRYNGEFTYRYVRNSETILEVKEDIGYTSHNDVAQSFTLTNPSKGCEGGYRANLVCRDCGGNSYTSSGSGHSYYTVEYVDLDREYPDSCGGYIRYNRCACGQGSDVYINTKCESTKHVSWSQEGADGYTHYFNQYICSDCGLEWVSDEYTIRNTANCNTIRRYTYAIRLNNVQIKAYQTQETWTSHNYGEVTYELAPGSATCEDGVIRSQTCKVCGYTSQDRYTSHELGISERVDLTPYGSVCGGELALYSCACGKFQRYDFSQDSQCDMDRKSIPNFIPGTIDTDQYTTQGLVYTYSDSCMITCAVTDPQCSMKIRMSEYWLEEDCMATEYQIWQLGYDETTGTCQKELQIATGEKHAYHPYESTSSVETLADGTTVNTSAKTCPKCSSSYIVKNHYLNDTRIKYERTASNTKDNGERKRWYEVDEYGVENKGYRYITLERTEYTYANGSDFWSQYAYVYDFPAGCVRTSTFTNSKGSYEVYMTDAHNTQYSWERLYDSTCTQFGAHVERWTCEICGKITSEYQYPDDPIAHSWNYDSTMQVYVCTICGLENINGASGAIVLEDMTAAYGNSTNYVVGYWNRDNVEARKYVSVILLNAVEEEVVLTDISFTDLRADKDGITAISFNQADTLAAAKAAMDGRSYTGNYAIRFTFVPVNTEDTLDYAITFDSQNA